MVEDELRHGFGTLDVDQVRARLEHLETRVRDRGHDPLGVLGRRRRVVRAGDDERRRVDLREARREVHALDDRAAVRVALVADGVEHRAQRIQRVRRAVWLGEPALHRRVDDRLRALRAHQLRAVGPVLRRAELGGRADRDELRDPVGRVGAEPQRRHPAQRDAGDVRALDAEVVEQVDDVLPGVVDRVRAGRDVRAAVARACRSESAGSARRACRPAGPTWRASCRASSRGRARVRPRGR